MKMKSLHFACILIGILSISPMLAWGKAVFNPANGVLSMKGVNIDGAGIAGGGMITLRLADGPGPLQKGSKFRLEGMTDDGSVVQPDSSYTSSDKTGEIPLLLVQPQGKTHEYRVRFKQANGENLVQVLSLIPLNAASYDAGNGELYIPRGNIRTRAAGAMQATLQRIGGAGPLVEGAEFNVISTSKAQQGEILLQAGYGANNDQGTIPEILTYENGRLLNYRALVQGFLGADGVPSKDDFYRITSLALNGADGVSGSQGPAGVPGADGEPGLPGLAWKSAWDAGIVYNTRDAVLHKGSSYIGLQDTNQNNEPPAADFWELLAAKGSAGPAGADGSAGPAGADGSAGPAGADGSAGPAGADGSAGSQGPAGATGATGATGPTGAQGPQGEQGVAGSGLTWQGEWSAAVSYNSYDGVQYGGNSYVCLQSNSNQSPPNATYWELLAAKGDRGDRGSSGSRGATGPAGPGGGDVTIVGDAGGPTAFTGNDDGNNLYFEGSSSDGNDTTLTVINPTAARTISLPDADGTLALATNNLSDLNNAATARTNLGIGTVENTAISTWTGSTAVATLGTIGTGTWQGTAVNATYIGVLDAGKTTSGIFDNARINWAAPGAIGTTTQAAGAFSTLRVGTSATLGNVLTADASGNATWQAAASADTDLSNLAGVAINASLISNADNIHDLGSGSNQWKDLYINGTANIDALVADTADINAGTVDAVIGGTTPAAGTFTSLTANANAAVKNGATSAGQLEMYENSATGTEKVILQAPTLATDYTLTLPINAGTNGQALSTNGSGVLSWAAVGTGDLLAAN
ncbi:MAG: hypothetical protein GY862_07725, partial [Gammaproteobacteria bacterium]|nr:hypothetical protein [Gammaproteobacteria bacterium]